MDSQRTAGQGDAKAHSETVGGAWGCGFRCAFTLRWPAARCESNDRGTLVGQSVA